MRFMHIAVCVGACAALSLLPDQTVNAEGPGLIRKITEWVKGKLHYVRSMLPKAPGRTTRIPNCLSCRRSSASKHSKRRRPETLPRTNTNEVPSVKPVGEVISYEKNQTSEHVIPLSGGALEEEPGQIDSRSLYIEVKGDDSDDGIPINTDNIIDDFSDDSVDDEALTDTNVEMDKTIYKEATYVAPDDETESEAESESIASFAVCRSYPDEYDGWSTIKCTLRSGKVVYTSGAPPRRVFDGDAEKLKKALERRNVGTWFLMLRNDASDIQKMLEGQEKGARVIELKVPDFQPVTSPKVQQVLQEVRRTPANQSVLVTDEGGCGRSGHLLAAVVLQEALQADNFEESAFEASTCQVRRNKDDPWSEVYCPALVQRVLALIRNVNEEYVETPGQVEELTEMMTEVWALKQSEDWCVKQGGVMKQKCEEITTQDKPAWKKIEALEKLQKRRVNGSAVCDEITDFVGKENLFRCKFGTGKTVYAGTEAMMRYHSQFVKSVTSKELDVKRVFTAVYPDYLTKIFTEVVDIQKDSDEYPLPQSTLLKVSNKENTLVLAWEDNKRSSTLLLGAALVQDGLTSAEDRATALTPTQCRLTTKPPPGQLVPMVECPAVVSYAVETLRRAGAGVLGSETEVRALSELAAAVVDPKLGKQPEV